VTLYDGEVVRVDSGGAVLHCSKSILCYSGLSSKNGGTLICEVRSTSST
jgi:hypothetical protein